MTGVETYKIGDWKLQSGQSIPDAEIAYKTFGDPTSPAIIYPTWFSGCMSALISHRTMLTLRSNC
jgi:homoserine acetyltransferase